MLLHCCKQRIYVYLEEEEGLDFLPALSKKNSYSSRKIFFSSPESLQRISHLGFFFFPIIVASVITYLMIKRGFCWIKLVCWSMHHLSTKNLLICKICFYAVNPVIEQYFLYKTSMCGIPFSQLKFFDPFLHFI